MERFRNRLIAITLAISQVLMPIAYVVSALSDLRAETIVKEVELDNQASTADFSMTKREKVDVVLSIDKYQLDQIGIVKAQAESIIKQKLLAENIYANVKIVDTPSKKINVLEYYPTVTKTVSKKYVSTSYPMLNNLVAKYNLQDYISVTSKEIPKTINDDLNSYDVVIPMGLYKNHSHEGKIVDTWNVVREVYLENVDKIDSLVANGGGVILTKGLGKFYNNLMIHENYRLPAPKVFTESTAPVDINISSIPRNYFSGVEYEFRATPTKKLSRSDGIYSDIEYDGSIDTYEVGYGEIPMLLS